MTVPAAHGARGARKKRPGRPSLPEAARRLVGMRLWATATEREAIHARARAAYLSVGDYLRRAALGQRIQPVQVPPVNEEARRQLVAIGHHLNRIVRATEAAGGQAVPPDLRPVLDDLRGQVEALALDLMGVPPGRGEG